MVVAVSPSSTMPTDKSPKKAQKRKADHDPQNDTKDGESKKKVHKQSYTEIEFCVGLRDPNTTFQALEDFLQTASDFPESTSYDIVRSYCRNSGECVEIFKLLEGDKRKPSELCLIFEVLEVILVNIARRLTPLSSVGKAVVRRVLAGHVGTIIFCLGVKNKTRHIKASLKLLSAMVMQGDNLPRDILSQLDLLHPVWPPLFERRDIRDPMDIRSCLIHFIFSFLMFGEKDTIRNMLEVKGFINGIFSGLIADKLVTLQMVLPTLREKVVQNSSLSKTLKIRLFTDNALLGLMQLYRWRGPIQRFDKIKKGAMNEDEQDDQASSEPLSEERQQIADMVHELLLQICCDFKLGINFFDKGHATSGKNHNHVLTMFLNSFKYPHQSSRLSELVVEVLRSCPDQLIWYLPTLKHSLIPRTSNKWVAAMALLLKVYEAQPEVAPCMNLLERVPISKLVSMARCNIVPPEEIWSQIMAAIRHKSNVVQHEGLIFLHLALRRVKATIDFCSEKNQLYSPEELKEFTSAFKDTITKLFPDVPSLMLCWSRGVRAVDNKLADATLQSEPGAEEETEKSDDEMDVDDIVAKGFPEVSLADHLLRVLQALCEYQAVLPEVFASCSVNFGLLLEGVRAMANEDSTSNYQVTLLQIHLLRLLAESSIKQVTWLKESLSGHSTLYLLLEMIVITHGDHKMLPVAINLLQKLFASTGLFVHAEAEIRLWLEGIATATQKEQQTEVLQFLEKVISAVLKDPFTYTEKVSETVSEAASLDSGLAFESGSTATTADQIIDSILSMDEVELPMGEYNSQTSTIPFTARYPFSALVTAALKIWTEDYKTKDSEDKGVKVYLSGVLADVLHSQTDPLPLCMLMQQFKCTSLMPLCKRWLANKKVSVTPKKQKPLSPDSLLQDLLLTTFSGPLSQLLLPETEVLLKGKINDVELNERERVLTQLLLYMRTCAHEAHQDDEKLGATVFYMKLIVTLIESIHTTETSQAQELTAHSDNMRDVHLGSLKVENFTVDGVFLSIFSALVKHPDLLDWFLWQQSFRTKPREVKIGAQLGKIVTSSLCDTLEMVPTELAPRLAEVLGSLRQKAREQFSSYVDGLLSGAVDTSEDYPDVLRAIGVVLRISPWEEVIEDVQKLCQLPAKDMIHKKELTAQGNLLMSFINHVLDSMNRSDALARNILSSLSLDSVAKIFSLATLHTIPEVDTLLLGLLRACPLYALAANQKHFLQCLKAPSGSAELKLVEILMAHSEACRYWFTSWWAGLAKAEKKNLKWSHLPLIYQHVLSMKSGIHTYVETSKGLKLIQTLYWSDLIVWIQTHVDSSEECQAKFALLRHLTRVSTDLESLQSSWSELLVFLTSCTQLHTLQAEYVYELSENVSRLDTEASLPVWDVYISTCLTCASSLLGGKAVKANKRAICVLIDKVLKVLEKNKGDGNERNLAEVVQPIWDQVIKAGLRSLYTNVNMLLVLKHLVGVVYSCHSEVLPANTVYEMLMSHSQFLGIMLESGNTPVKDALVDLMLFLVQTEPDKCCKTAAHLSVFLGSYGATLHKTDQKLLLLMRLYEKTGCSLDDHRPFLWGPKAVEHHSVKKNLGSSLWKRASSDQVLELIDCGKLEHSYLHFPVQRKLNNEAVVDPAHVASLPDVYDPGFILPLFSHLLGPGMMVQCFRLVESGALSYVFSALSSHDPAMRGAAYHLLAEFCLHAEGLRFPGKNQVLYLLQTVRNSITSSNMKLASVITVFLAKAAKLMVNPDADMYSGVNEFLLCKPSMDVLGVPEFYKFFHSSHLEYKVERAWMLSLLADGLRETADYRVYVKKYVFKLILSFHDSDLCDEQTQLLVLKVVHQAVKQRTVVLDLLKNDALLVWINSVMSSRYRSDEKKGLLVDILDSLWKTLSLVRCNSEGQMKSAFVPLAFSNEMLHVLVNLLHTMRGVEDVRVISKYTTLVESVLLHLSTIASTTSRQDPVCSRLSCSDCLELLYVWSTVTSDHKAVGDFSNLSKSFNKNLRQVGLRKRAKYSNLRRKTKGDGEAEKEITEEERKEIEKASIRSVLEILGHWKPIQHQMQDSGQSESCVSEVSSLLYIVNWSINQLFKNFPSDLELFSKILHWVHAWVLNHNSHHFRVVLISDKASAIEFISNMLSIYGHCTRRLLDRSDIGSSSSKENRVNLTNKIKVKVTQVLAALIDNALKPGEIVKGSMLQKLLQQAAYSTAIKLMPKVQQNQSTLYLLIQELWLRASKPSQFMFMANQVIEDSV